MLVAALLLPLALTSKIDFDSRAMAVGQVLAALSTKAGVHMRSSASLAPQVIYVHVRDADLVTIKQKIADVLQAHWEAEKDGDLLTRNHADEKRIWAEHVAYRRKVVDEALKDSTKRLEKPFDGKSLARALSEVKEPDQTNQEAVRQYYTAMKGFESQSPSSRLLSRLVLACSREDLAGLGPYSRRVFRPNPTAAQYGIDPGKFRTAMSQFRQEQQEWIDEAAKVTFEESRNGRMVSDPRAQLGIPPTLDFSQLTITRGEMTSLFLVNLEAQQGPFPTPSVVAQFAYADPGRRFLDASMNPTPPDPNDPEVPMSDEAKEFNERLLASFSASAPQALSAHLKEMMLGAETNDPLNWGVADILGCYAKTKDTNVIAAVPDLALSIAISASRTGPLHLGQAIKALTDSGTLQMQAKDGWTAMTPPDRYESELDFTPRVAAVQLMKTTFAKGGFDMRAYAKYAFDSNRLNRGGFGDFFLAMFDRSVLGASDRTDWKALQLYGAFDADGQRALQSGKAMPYGALNASQRGIVDRIVYAKRLGGEVSPKVVSYNAVEPTQEFPNGVPASCTISATVRSEPVIVAYNRDESGGSKPSRKIDPWTLASFETDIVGHPDMMARYGMGDPAGYAMGAEKIVTMRVLVSPKAYADLSITVPEYDADAKPTPWNQLPEAQRKAIEQAMAQYKAQKSGTGGTPPP